MPLVRSRPATVSEGCAPCSSQWRARSSSNSISDGLVCGLYWPIVSIVRPSRGERLSATTIRQIGFFLEPTRLSLILTAIGRGRLQNRTPPPLLRRGRDNDHRRSRSRASASGGGYRRRIFGRCAPPLICASCCGSGILPEAIDRIILRIWSNCLTSWLTCWTRVPEPLAMRLRRGALVIPGLAPPARGHRRVIAPDPAPPPPPTAALFSCFFPPPPGNLPHKPPRGP